MSARAPRICRQCRCTDGLACRTVDGACGWAEKDLCTACADQNRRGRVLQFAHLREMNVLRAGHLFPFAEQWTPADFAVALTAKHGRVCELIGQLKRGLEVKPQDIGRSIGELVITLDLLAARLELNLGTEVQDAFNETSHEQQSPYRL